MVTGPTNELFRVRSASMPGNGLEYASEGGARLEAAPSASLDLSLRGSNRDIRCLQSNPREYDNSRIRLSAARVGHCERLGFPGGSRLLNFGGPGF
jgi:hypothetical protein